MQYFETYSLFWFACMMLHNLGAAWIGAPTIHSYE